APDQIVQENQLGGAGEQRGDCYEPVQGNQRFQVVVRECRVATYVTGQAEIVHREKDAIDADEGEPEVPLAERLVHHAAEHLGEPEVRAGEDAEHRGNRHHEVEVGHNEVGGVQIGIDRRLRQEEATQPAAHEHR